MAQPFFLSFLHLFFIFILNTLSPLLTPRVIHITLNFVAFYRFFTKPVIVPLFARYKKGVHKCTPFSKVCLFS